MKMFAVFVVLLCGAVGAFLMQDSPKDAPFSVESNQNVLKAQMTNGGGAE